MTKFQLHKTNKELTEILKELQRSVILIWTYHQKTPSEEM